MTLFSASALAIAALLAQGAPANPPANSLECVYNRLDRAYLAGIWVRFSAGGIAIDDPTLENLGVAGMACEEQFGWGRSQASLALYYGMMRAGFETLLAARIAREDHAAMSEAIRRYGEINGERFFELVTADIRQNSDVNPTFREAREGFRGFMASFNPELLGRISEDDLWAVALPGIVSKTIESRFAAIPAGS